MKKIIFPVLIALSFFSCKSEQDEASTAMTEEEIIRKADSLAHTFIITDGHVDLPYRLKNNGISEINEQNGNH